MSTRVGFNPDVLKIDPAAASGQIEEALRVGVFQQLKRKGAVVGLSGGLDSSVAAALCARALGKERVFGLLMPEAESSPESLRLGRLVAEWLRLPYWVEDIEPLLRAAGCYERRDQAIRSLLPEYGPGHKSKLVLSNVLDGAQYRVFFLLVQAPNGVDTKIRLTADAYRAIVAATNFKQRARKMMEYHHADRLQYAVVGTPNRLEYDQGFFVKNGDGAADLKPLAHLYKTQVQQLADYLGIPAEIRDRTPVTDTFSLPQSQEEFYFSVPLEQLDLCLYGKNHGVAPAEVAEATGLTPEQVERVYRDIEAKRQATRYLHMKPLLVEDIAEFQENS